jgi:hypothetical protein
LIALGDGRVLYYEIQNDGLGNMTFPTGPPKKIFSIGANSPFLISFALDDTILLKFRSYVLGSGTTPARLSVIEFNKKAHFFVCTNKPAILVSDDSGNNLKYNSEKDPIKASLPFALTSFH